MVAKGVECLPHGKLQRGDVASEVVEPGLAAFAMSMGQARVFGVLRREVTQLAFERPRVAAAMSGTRAFSRRHLVVAVISFARRSR